MNIYQKRAIFRRRNESSVYRMFFWITLILVGIWLVRSVNRGDIKPLFLPTSTPTRLAISYAQEGEALFTAGQMNDTVDPNGKAVPGAITSYLEAVKVDPNNAQAWAQLARVQTYSSAMMVGEAEIKTRLADALTSAEKAVELAPDDSFTNAIYSFTLDWNANPDLVGDRKAQELLANADKAASRALLLDPSNALARAYYAEILVDEQKWTQAQQNIDQALAADPSSMDIHRVDAAVLEAQGQYALAIDAYDRAIAITPNLTFLYRRAGANYRVLAFNSLNETVQRQLFEKALEYFAQAVRINDQLGIQDPAPFLSIAKTYSQMGQFFIAIRNVQKTIEFQPDKAEFYGELGVLYHKNRNYETGILAFKCAIDGCTGDESCDGRGGCGSKDVKAVVTGLPLSSLTIYYYDIYASELAALSTPKNDHCPKALEVAGKIAASDFYKDPNIAADIMVVHNICPLSSQEPTATIESVITSGTPTTSP